MHWLQTDEAVPMDTEAQMKEAAAALKEEEQGDSKAASSGQDEEMVRHLSQDALWVLFTPNLVVIANPIIIPRV